MKQQSSKFHRKLVYMTVLRNSSKKKFFVEMKSGIVANVKIM